MISSTNLPDDELYSAEQLAKKLDMTSEWVKYNRIKSKNPIPYKRFGGLIRYHKADILTWIGRKDLELEFYSSEKVAAMLGVSLNWLNHNRNSNDPIPFRRFGRIVRYNKTDLHHFINKKKKIS